MADRYPDTVIVTSRAIARHPYIAAQLGARIQPLSRLARATGRLSGFSLPPSGSAIKTTLAGWGYRPSGVLARELAARYGLPSLTLEDGFLRSAGDATDPQNLSLCADDCGIYYDASQASQLEGLIAAGIAEKDRSRSQALMRLWRHHRLSKYNHVRDTQFAIAPGYILLVDQTAGDCSIARGMASDASFRHMLEAALDEYPHRQIVLKLHPEVAAGRRQGHFQSLSAGSAARIQLIATPAHAPDLIEHAHAVYTVTSQLGFEALLWGREVHTFGMPFYAGWGLTRDTLTAPARRCAKQLDDLVHAALIAYPRYADPETGERCEAEDVIAHIALQRRMRASFPEVIHAIGFSRWKKPVARAFFSGSELQFLRRKDRIPASAQAMACWGSPSAAIGHVQAAAARPCIRVEDGFLRSVGLGAQLLSPLSWVLDADGIHYDASQPSGLDKLLAQGTFDEALLLRARTLAASLIRLGINKYNVSGQAWRRPDSTRKIILVVGQVEDDASVRSGSTRIKTNLALLREVRERDPAALLVYKPHPDVEKGLRRGGAPIRAARPYFDIIARQTSINDLLDHADEVHVMTSLAGFEALLRNKKVVTYGWPFYAGRGLTEDRDAAGLQRPPCTLEQLIAVTLILYPRYVSARSGRFTTPERVLADITAMRTAIATRRQARLPWRSLRMLISLSAWFHRRANRV